MKDLVFILVGVILITMYWPEENGRLVGATYRDFKAAFEKELDKKETE